MNIKFSITTQAFYDVTLNYLDLPDDLIEVTNEQHMQLLNALNSGCIIFSDLTYSAPKPSQFHTWDGTTWVDNRTHEEITAYNRSLLPALTKRQFALYLYDSNQYDQVMSAINANPRFKIEYDSVSDIDRLSPTVSAMTALLGWSDEQVDEMWNKALTL